MLNARVWSVVGPIFNVEMGVACVPGDLIYYSGANDDWRLADADDNATYAQAIVVTTPNIVVDGTVVTACKECYIVDTDAAAFSENARLYLSTTAGAITETRPTGADDLRQVVGQTVAQTDAEFGNADADKTMLAHIKIQEPHEFHQYVPFTAGTDVGAIFQLDSGNFCGASVNAQNEVSFATVQVPENVVGTAPKIAYLWLAAEATGGTPTFDLFVSAANDGDQWDANTQDATITASADEGAAADEIQRTDVTTAFDTNIEPGRILGVRVLAADSGTDIRFHFGIQFVWECV